METNPSPSFSRPHPPPARKREPSLAELLAAILKRDRGRVVVSTPFYIFHYCVMSEADQRLASLFPRGLRNLLGVVV